MGRGSMLGCSDWTQVDGQADGRRGRVSRRALSLALATAVTLLTIAVGSALAAQQVISTSGPINNIYLNDTLECQATHVGDTTGEFFARDSTLETAARSDTGSQRHRLRILGHRLHPVGQSPVTGAGTASSPFQVTTNVSVPPALSTITQTDSYVVGQEQYRTDITVHNGDPANPVGATLYHAADCYPARVR